MSSATSQPPHLPRTRLALALRGVLFTSTTAMTLFIPPAYAEQAQVHRYDLPAGTLEQSLNAFAQTAGINLPFNPGMVQGKRAPALRGEYAVAQGLEILLSGSGLAASRTAAGNWMLYQLMNAGAALELDTTMISGQGMGQATENSGSYTTGLVSAGSKTPTSLKNTPQSVSVVSQQLIEDLRMVDLSDALKRAPGITVKNSNYRLPQFLSRGFPIDNIQIDGASPMDIGSGIGTFYANKTYDMAEFDHIEILRGASGLFGGTGDPGGIINAVRKRPLDYNQLKINTSAGSWDNYRSEIDVTGPIAFDGRLRGRVVTAYTDRQYFYDNRSTDKPFIYAVLEADLTDSARVTVGGRYERIHENGTGDGLPRYSTGKDLKLGRSTWYTPNWAYSDNASQEWFVKYDQDLGETWKLNVSFTNTYDKTEAKSAFLWGAPDPETMQGATWGGSFIKSWSEQSLFDANVSGTFSAFGREHELLVGADAQKVTSRWRATGGMTDIIPIDVYNPNATPLGPDAIGDELTRDYSPNTRKQYGLYSTLRLQLTDPLQLIVGARAQRYKYEQKYQTVNAKTGAWEAQPGIDYREPTKMVPFGGLVYALDEQWSAYASYSEIFKPQAQRREGPVTSGKTVEPMVGKTYETGLKGELFNSSLNVSAALFYTQREHEAVLDPAHTGQSVLYGGSCCYLPQGEVVSKGVDLEASGELLPGLMVMGGYTYTNTRNRETSKAFSSVTPKHLAKLWAVYTLPDRMSQWKVGGGVTAQSANFVSGESYRLDSKGNPYSTTPFDFSQGGYAVWDTMVEYQLDEHWTVALNGNNLFDRKYVETVNTAEYGNYYGAPRNYMLTLRGQF
jgi:outer membrane receptor for ferric coprogen and ferric-rhodotorulic acid